MNSRHARQRPVSVSVTDQARQSRQLPVGKNRFAHRVQRDAHNRATLRPQVRHAPAVARARFRQRTQIVSCAHIGA